MGWSGAWPRCSRIWIGRPDCSATLRDHVGEQLAADQARARAGHQHSVGLEHVERGQVEPEVALERLLDVAWPAWRYLGGSQMTTSNRLPSARRRSSTSSTSPSSNRHRSSPLIAACWRASSIARAELSTPERRRARRA